MIQVPTQCFASKCSKAKTFVENDMPLGGFHDYLLELIGMMVDRMIAAHKERIEMANNQKKEETESTEAPTPSCEGSSCSQ